MMPKIWLIGGTRESVVLATALIKQKIPFVVTVTTETAQRMYGEVVGPSPPTQIHIGAIPREQMADWLQSQAIAGLLDASHPFATEVSAGAIASANQAQLPYLRFERTAISPSTALPLSTIPISTDPHSETSPSPASVITRVPNLEALLTPQQLSNQRILLVLGYRMLHHFQAWQTRSQLFARILPSQVALEAAFAAGFTSDRLIALRPPVSPELERSLWQQWGITKVIAKCSGKAGGETTKRDVAQALQIPLCLIQRPAMDYPQQTNSLERAIAFAQSSLTNASHTLARTTRNQ